MIARLGRSANWHQNAKKPTGRPNSPSAASASHHAIATYQASFVLAEYERRNRLIAPIIRGVLSRLIGRRYDGSDTARRQLVIQLPVIGLRPAHRS